MRYTAELPGPPTCLQLFYNDGGEGGQQVVHGTIDWIDEDDDEDNDDEDMDDEDTDNENDNDQVLYGTADGKIGLMTLARESPETG